MKTISVRNPNHDFQKQNLTTITDRTGSYDKMKCSKCGIEGKRYNLTSIVFSQRTNDLKIKFCVNADKKKKELNSNVKIEYVGVMAHLGESKGWEEVYDSNASGFENDENATETINGYVKEFNRTLRPREELRQVLKILKRKTTVENIVISK